MERIIDSPPVVLVQEALTEVLNSRTFRSAAGQREFLRFVVQESLAGRAHMIKEYSIGMGALERGERFDPRLDPIVRTQARKLRARLARYYQSEGSLAPVVIELDKGGYVPRFQLRQQHSRGLE
jgi:hypothetical protein